MINWYPLLLSMDHKTVVIVGGGKIAFRKAKSFEQTGASVIVISPEILPELEDLSFVRCKKKTFERSDLEGAHLIFAATDQNDVNKYVVSCASPHQWVNNVSDGNTSNFINPAVVRRGDLVLTASTSGNSPVLAKEIKRQWEEQFGAEYEDIVKEYRDKRKTSVQE